MGGRELNYRLENTEILRGDPTRTSRPHPATLPRGRSS
jgi:hypothetical protein